MMKCSVVIPYYQRTAGILRRAIASALAQTHADIEIILVDDGSPSSVAAELEGLGPDQRERIIVLRQANAGPAAARNAGLDAVSFDSAFVAFLDSDDEWAPDHLKTAVAAMTLFNADCYWASISGDAAFDYHRDIASLAGTDELTRLSDEPTIFGVSDLPGMMLRNWSFMHLSCMVLGPSLFRTIRFERSLRLAAEDVLFFYECARNARRPILCAQTGAVRGEGVNIFHGVDNTSPQFLQQQFNTWAAFDRLGRRFEHAPKDRASIESRKRAARAKALWGQARLVRGRKLPQFRQLARWAWRDPAIIGSAMDLAVAKLFKSPTASDA